MAPTVSSNFTKRSLTADDIDGYRRLYPDAAGPVPAPLKGNFSIRQVSNGRFVDAHEIAGQDFRLVTRPAQNNDTQRWQLTLVGRVYTIQQVSNSRFVDAHEHSGEDFRLVTRPAQNNNTQLWALLHTGPDTYSIQQVSNGRYVDAHESAGQDFRVVTRPQQNNNTQRWLVEAV